MNDKMQHTKLCIKLCVIFFAPCSKFYAELVSHKLDKYYASKPCVPSNPVADVNANIKSKCLALFPYLVSDINLALLIKQKGYSAWMCEATHQAQVTHVQLSGPDVEFNS